MLNKSSVLEPLVKPILDISNMDILDSDEEDEHVTHIDKDLGSLLAPVSILEPELDTSSSSTSQNFQDTQSNFTSTNQCSTTSHHFTSIYLSERGL